MNSMTHAHGQKSVRNSFKNIRCRVTKSVTGASNVVKHLNKQRRHFLNSNHKQVSESLMTIFAEFSWKMQSETSFNAY